MPPELPLPDRVLAGDLRAIARAISVVESDSNGAADLLRVLHRHAGRASIVGVTGPPGAGKSTLVDRLTAAVRAGRQTVGILAVDPSSPFSGGAVLGDRIRMGSHAGDEGVYVRSMATRGHLGGLARATADAAVVLDAAGRDVIIIETVGVGQDEVDIVRVADVSVVVLVPGTGDDVQALKAGIMEIADIFVVNKSDREGADQLVQAVVAALALQSPEPGAWIPPVIKTEATTGRGVDELWAAIGAFVTHSSGTRRARTRARHERQLRELMVRHAIQAVERALPAGLFETMVDRVVARDVDPHTAALELLARARAEGA